MTRIAKRGPVVVKLASGGTLDLWYDRAQRLWILQQKDAEGNQTGPGYGGEASYSADRQDAVNEMQSILSKETTP
jgi:hypothetical protein